MRKTFFQRVCCFVLLGSIFGMLSCANSKGTTNPPEQTSSSTQTSVTEAVTTSEKKKETEISSEMTTVTGVQTLLQHEDWSEDVKENVNAFLKMYGKFSDYYPQNHYVVFDCDNTTTIYDVEHALTAYQIEQMVYAMTPEKLSAVLHEVVIGNQNALISDIVSAYKSLYEVYGPFDGNLMDMDKVRMMREDLFWEEFSAKMLFFYQYMCNQEKVAGCLFPLQLFTDMTPKQVYDLAYSCYTTWDDVDTETVVWSSPEDLDSAAGQLTAAFVKGVSVTDNLRELYQALYDNGIDIFIVSASGTVPVQAALDAFGLRDYVTGMTGMNMLVEDGKYTTKYNLINSSFYYTEGDQWVHDDSILTNMPIDEGKTEVIMDGLYKKYNGGPLAGFMDSSGDYNFCTSFASLKMVICFNIANKGVNDPAFWIAGAAIYERDILGYDIKTANEKGHTLYLLQGRNENWGRSLINSNKTIKLGYEEAILFASEENQDRLDRWIDEQAEISDILGEKYYHSIK